VGGVNVEIWSDLVCPFCYIGKRNWEAALERFEERESLDVRWRSFQLDPMAPRVSDVDLHEHLGAKYGGGREAGKAMNDRVARAAADVGLRFELDTARRGNTLDAHRVVHLARTRGLEEAAVERLFAAYFTESEAIGEPETLARLASGVGLDAGEVRAMLAGEDHADAVRAEMREGMQLGINAVPCFVFERRSGVSGAQPPEVLLSALERAWAERSEAAA
jgi:predicted DsbA family dithiol-disulfide isomerase